MMTEKPIRLMLNVPVSNMMGIFSLFIDKLIAEDLDHRGIWYIFIEYVSKSIDSIATPIDRRIVSEDVVSELNYIYTANLFDTKDLRYGLNALLTYINPSLTEIISEFNRQGRTIRYVDGLWDGNPHCSLPCLVFSSMEVVVNVGQPSY